MWCDGLITPIFKCGTKSDPLNYHAIGRFYARDIKVI